MNWFNLSFIGWVILIIALAIAAYMLHAPMVWIGIGALALLGIGIITSAATPNRGYEEVAERLERKTPAHAAGVLSIWACRSSNSFRGHHPAQRLDGASAESLSFSAIERSGDHALCL